MPDTIIWDRLAGLSLVVDGYSLERLEGLELHGFERTTTLIRLTGAGEEGSARTCSPARNPPRCTSPARCSHWPGEWTLASFCEHLATLDQWPEPPEWEMARQWRNWALRVGGAGSRAAAGGAVARRGRGSLESRPLRFVNSLGLGDPPSAATIARRVERYPTVGFKLDAAAVVDAGDRATSSAALGCVDTVDFKGRYGLEVEDEDALVAMYRTVLDAFPYALFEDPHELARSRRCSARCAIGVSFDAPIRTPADVARRGRSTSSRRGSAALQPLLRALRVVRRQRRGDVRRRDGRARRSAAGRSSCSRRCFTRTRPTTSRRRRSTPRSWRTACRRAR